VVGRCEYSNTARSEALERRYVAMHMGANIERGVSTLATKELLRKLAALLHSTTATTTNRYFAADICTLEKQCNDETPACIHTSAKMKSTRQPYFCTRSYREGVKGLSMGILFTPQCSRGTGGSSSCSSEPTAILRWGFLVEPAFRTTASSVVSAVLVLCICVVPRRTAERRSIVRTKSTTHGEPKETKAEGSGDHSSQVGQHVSTAISRAHAQR